MDNDNEDQPAGWDKIRQTASKLKAVASLNRGNTNVTAKQSDRIDND